MTLFPTQSLITFMLTRLGSTLVDSSSGNFICLSSFWFLLRHGKMEGRGRNATVRRCTTPRTNICPGLQVESCASLATETRR